MIMILNSFMEDVVLVKKRLKRIYSMSVDWAKFMLGLEFRTNMLLLR